MDPVDSVPQERHGDATVAPISNSPTATTAVVLVPQLSKFGITERDLESAVRVLHAVSSLDPSNRKKRKHETIPGGIKPSDAKKIDDSDNPEQGDEEDDDGGLAQYRKPNLRRFRKALSKCLSLHQRTMYDGKPESEFYERRLAERTLKRQKMAEMALQRKYVAATDLRRGRVERLQRLREESREEEEAKLMRLLVPDGHVDMDAASRGNGDVKLLENKNACVGYDGRSGSNGGSKYGKLMDARNDSDNGEKATVLPKLRSCYVCKARFRLLHHFYDQICPDCAPFNYSKRRQSADMSGKVAVVTGSRVKIGYQVCLKLLRAGATVVATTRFPNSAADAYRREADFGEWGRRLRVYGLDLRDMTGVEAFTRYLKAAYGNRGVDVLVNNACQTVRRPAGYYLPLVESERKLWAQGDVSHRDMLRGCAEFEQIRRRLVVEYSNPGRSNNGGNLLLHGVGSSGRDKLLLGNGLVRRGSGETCGASKMESHAIVAKQNPCTNKNSTPFESTGISHSTAMSQMAIIPEDVGIDEKVMPPGLSDINGQQLDLRTSNSWLLKIDQVSTPEVMECMLVNAIAPFVLNSRLKPLMEAPVGDLGRPDRYIVNVSAMEGKFYRYKMPNHPHTNMAKAALNMLTRTSSEDLARKSRIFMNSVDTGWINDENPLEKASKIAQANLFQTPIDEVDAAARILDPVFVGINLDHTEGTEGKKPLKDYGKFFKDYKETEW